MTLGDVWFILIGVLLAGYAVFDGFDLGVGTLYPFLGKSEEDKAVMRRAIGPVWDGNEVWLLTGGGALFAAFPAVYATVFSGFYLALMLVLFSLILRAAALEFRHADPAWGKFWDGAFFIGSALPSLLFGVAVGNIIRGVPLTKAGEMMAAGAPVFGANLLAAVNLYSLFMGLFCLTWIVWHGAVWLSLKTTGELYERARNVRDSMWMLFMVGFLGISLATALMVPEAFGRAVTNPFIWIAALLVVGGAVLSRMSGRKGNDRVAWYGSSIAVLGMMTCWAATIYPNLLPSIGEGKSLAVRNSANAINAASSDLTLTVMLIISAIGVPLVLYYFHLIYKTYSGRIDVSEVSEHY